MLKNSSWSLIKKLIHCPIHHLQLVLLKALKVHTTDQFFIVTRRGASLDRRLALWKRESLKSSPIKKLIHSGINSGAPGGACRKSFFGIISRFSSHHPYLLGQINLVLKKNR